MKNIPKMVVTFLVLTGVIILLYNFTLVSGPANTDEHIVTSLPTSTVINNEDLAGYCYY